MPASSPGNMGGSVREPALSVALWLSWGAVLGAVTCAVALLLQQTELQSLRREVSRLQQRSGAPSQKRGECPWQSLWEQVSKGGGETWGEGGMAKGSQGPQSATFQVGARGSPGFGSQRNSHSRKIDCYRLILLVARTPWKGVSAQSRGLGQVQKSELFLALGRAGDEGCLRPLCL